MTTYCKHELIKESCPDCSEPCSVCNGPSTDHNCMEYLTGRVRELEEAKNIKIIGNDVIQEIVQEAFMAGQIDADIAPSWSSAQAYYNGLFSNKE